MQRSAGRHAIRLATIAFAGIGILGGAAVGAETDVVRDGAHGFPQAEATVVCRRPDLRVSVWNDASHLYVQAVLFEDDSAELGETPDGREVGDSSSLVLDVDADGAVTKDVDRSYSLNPWPSLPGLRYSVQLGGGMSTPLKSDSKGRGVISYEAMPDGTRVRVDSFVVPLAEIGRAPGDAIILAFWAQSAKPKRYYNSVGYDHDGAYYPHHLPRDHRHRLTLADRPSSIDVARVPRGRDAVVASAKPPLGKVPAVGAAPPELTAEEWMHVDGPLTLEKLKGRVVVVEFWATWCGPCVKNIPHLRELHAKHEKNGLTVIGFTDQSRKGVEDFVERNEMDYVIATGSNLGRTYGVTGIPHAFVIGRDGTLVWHGHPALPAFDEAVQEALAERG